MSNLENPDDPNDGAKLKAILTLCAALAFVAAPLMTQPFSGFDPDRFPNPTSPLPLQPAGYAFALWGVIYAWLVASAFYGLIRRDVDRGWDRTRWPLFVSMALGAGWIGVALLNPLIATVLIFAMLGGAVWALLRAPAHDHWWLAAPIGLYAGWLTAASFVAFATTLSGWTALSPLVSSFVGLIGVALVAAAVLSRRPPVTYGIAVIWALIGVIVGIAGAASPAWLIGACVLLAIMAVAFATWRGARV